jgi:hypothetical protein
VLGGLEFRLLSRTSRRIAYGSLEYSLGDADGAEISSVTTYRLVLTFPIKTADWLIHLRCSQWLITGGAR